MQGRAEFDIRGRIGTITPMTKSLKVSIAADYPSRDEGGGRHANTHWNAVTVFGESTIKWATSKLKPGDIVSARGRVRQNSYEKDGERIYTVDLIATDLTLIVAKDWLRPREEDIAA